MSIARIISVLVLGVMLHACGGPEQSPEALIRALVAEIEQAAEDRDIAVFKDHVSDDYQDGQGYDRQTVLRIVQGVFLRNQDIHLLSIVRDLKIDGSSANASVLVAMAGSPIESAQSLVNIRADLMRFDVELALEGNEWRARAVDWRRAEVNDFL